ncbi:Ger(x)C family spore germination protein [Brevibacillus choshinensis]|uniref:Ger(x)C family spore germination protein n=1 Tax=Brevibacillus choshinensis TaxID=54911 RepID=UPI002E22D577|nr:Ger(x)C family spore germination protein [Brevibacillus choshinensis]MED4750891.1 Ger(x)C family spore germination protein [Brevibacillus choshinensis]
MTNFIHHRVTLLSLSAMWIALGLLCLVLTACSSSRIINDVQLIHTLGYDQVDNKIKGTAITHRYEKDQENVEMLATSAINLYSIFPEFNATTPSQLELGQLRSVVIGKDFAAKGIGTLVHSLCRDPNIGFRLQLAIADPKAESILEVNRKVNVPFLLSNTIEQNIKTLNTPKSNLHVFLFNLYGEGRDPYLPYFVLYQDRIKLDGLALFHKDKFVEHIHANEAFLLKVLVEKSKSGQYPIEIEIAGRKGKGMLRNLGSDVAFEVNTSKNIPALKIQINMHAQIKDYPSWLKLSQPDTLQATEKELSLYLQKQMKQFLSHLQKIKVDPVGIGDLIRGRSSTWNYTQFQEQYPDMDLSVNIALKLEQTGVGE